MRVLIRFIGLCLIFLCTIYAFVNLVAFGLAYDELNEVSSLAMSNTQLLMSEIVEDRVLGRDTARYLFNDDESYFANYCESLKVLTGDDDRYEVEMVAADYGKGLLCVEVKRRVINRYISKELLSIVEVSDVKRSD